jgi:hypothetical protein
MNYCINHPDKLAEGRTTLCASCNRLERKAAAMKIPDDPEPIKKVSDNQSKLLARYNAKRKAWLRGKKCAVHPDCKEPLTCHHMHGRIGYADEYAREIDLPLLLDERFWLPVCIEAHNYIETHPKWAFENQYSFKRVTDPIFVKH